MAKNILKTLAGLFLFVVAFGLIASIIDPGIMQSDAEEEPVAEEHQQETEQQEPRGLLVTREEFGDDWPFTVDSGRVDCRQGGAAVLIVDQWVYQLNGVAAQKGYADLAPIWRDNPEIPGTKVSVGPMIRLALQQC